MDLREFVKESIVQIAKGIEEANDELSESSAMVNPFHIAANSDSVQAYAITKPPSQRHPDARIVEKIQFDVAVVAKLGKEGSAGAKLSIASIGIGTQGKVESSNKSESRIQFAIPIVYPGYENES